MAVLGRFSGITSIYKATHKSFKFVISNLTKNKNKYKMITLLSKGKEANSVGQK